MSLKPKDLEKMDISELEKKEVELENTLITASPDQRPSLKKSLARVKTILHKKRSAKQ